MDAIVTCPVCVCTWALRRLQGCDVQSCELDEILQEQAEAKGLKPQRPWQLLTDRSVRWQLVSVVITSSAMQLCGNDSVRGARQTRRGCVLSRRIWEMDVEPQDQRCDSGRAVRGLIGNLSPAQIVSCLGFITGAIINAYWPASLAATWKCVIAPCFLGSKLQENAD